jgi:hypothetical protein
MHGSREIEDLYKFYRSPETAKYSGPAMVQFLDLVADILQSKLVYFGTSHESLGLSRVGTYPESWQEPSVWISADGDRFNLVYAERWQDGPYFRMREDHVRCTIEHVRTALLELLARLKPPAA